mmetsp:Transcript_10808/g.27322  ORF Transcript_10808/g.27322 Transcript_10808/m.27322 type:complete len:281 (-) Transcript_10808:164-1006(-)
MVPAILGGKLQLLARPVLEEAPHKPVRHARGLVLGRRHEQRLRRVADEVERHVGELAAPHGVLKVHRHNVVRHELQAVEVALPHKDFKALQPVAHALARAVSAAVACAVARVQLAGVTVVGRKDPPQALHAARRARPLEAVDAVGVHGAKVCALLVQPLAALQVGAHHGAVQGGVQAAAFYVDVGPHEQQQAQALKRPLQRGDVDGLVTHNVAHLHIRPLADQELHQLGVVPCARVMQRRVAVATRQVDVRPGRTEKLDHLHLAAATSDVQRGLVAVIHF